MRAAIGVSPVRREVGLGWDGIGWFSLGLGAKAGKPPVRGEGLGWGLGGTRAA
jgi:hypothetical protein